MAGFGRRFRDGMVGGDGKSPMQPVELVDVTFSVFQEVTILGLLPASQYRYPAATIRQVASGSSFSAMLNIVPISTASRRMQIHP